MLCEVSWSLGHTDPYSCFLLAHVPEALLSCSLPLVAPSITGLSCLRWKRVTQQCGEHTVGAPGIGFTVCSYKCYIWTSSEWLVLHLPHSSCPGCPTSCLASQWGTDCWAERGDSSSSGMWLSPRSGTEHPSAPLWGLAGTHCLSKGECYQEQVFLGRSVAVLAFPSLKSTGMGPLVG